jgi:hypothetical protein
MGWFSKLVQPTPDVVANRYFGASLHGTEEDRQGAAISLLCAFRLDHNDRYPSSMDELERWVDAEFGRHIGHVYLDWSTFFVHVAARHGTTLDAYAAKLVAESQQKQGNVPPAAPAPKPVPPAAPATINAPVTTVAPPQTVSAPLDQRPLIDIRAKASEEGRRAYLEGKPRSNPYDTLRHHWTYGWDRAQAQEEQRLAAPRQAQAVEEGCQAYLEGKPESSNPYSREAKVLACYWTYGWMKTKITSSAGDIENLNNQLKALEESHKKALHGAHLTEILLNVRARDALKDEPVTGKSADNGSSLPPQVVSAIAPATLITVEDEMAYGTELIDLAKRAAKDALGPALDTLKQEILSQLHPPRFPLIPAEDERNYGEELIDLFERAAKHAVHPELNALRKELISALNSDADRQDKWRTKFLRADDDENYGSELTDFAQRAARETVGPDLGALRKEVQKRTAVRNNATDGSAGP